jgi:hypothetical protein
MGHIQNSFGWCDSPNSYFKYPDVTFFTCLYFGCHLCCTNNYRFKTTSLPSSSSSLKIIYKMSITANSYFVWFCKNCPRQQLVSVRDSQYSGVDKSVVYKGVTILRAQSRGQLEKAFGKVAVRIKKLHVIG